MHQTFHWKSLQSLKFIVQVSLSVAVLSLCIGKLVAPNASADDKALYWGGLTSIIAWWMPSPGLEKPGEPT